MTHIVGIGGITRSGRCYGLEGGEKRKNKEKIAKREPKKEIKDKEEEFLKIMKQSKYEVIEQLKKTLARISLLSLILTSETHRKALLKMLNEPCVKLDVTAQNVIGMVDPVKHVNLITFSEKEIIPQPAKNLRALHMTLKCKGFIVANVLIDGRSAINVLPK